MSSLIVKDFRVVPGELSAPKSRQTIQWQLAGEEDGTTGASKY